jgi:hypothetical protein
VRYTVPHSGERVVTTVYSREAAEKLARETKGEIVPVGTRGVLPKLKLKEPLRVDPQGMRPESLEYLRENGPVNQDLPVTIAYFPGEKQPRIIDGRHRITVARERNARDKSMATHVVADVIKYDRQLNIVSRRRMRIPTT